MYKPEEDMLLKGLTYSEVRAVVGSLNKKERANWCVWRQGWQDWHPISDIDEFHQQLDRPIPGAIPPLPTADDAGTVTEGIKTLMTTAKVSDGKNKKAEYVPMSAIPDVEVEHEGSEFVFRNHRRFKKRLPVTIECHGRKVKSHTVDISVGGIHIEDSLPEWVAGYCVVKIKNPLNKQVIEVTCSIVENQRKGQRTRLELLPLKSHKEEMAFQYWIEAA